MIPRILHNTANEILLRLEFRPEDGFVSAHWSGFISADQLRAGLLAECAAVRECGSPLLLHNRRGTYATPTILQSWLVEELTPMLYAAGLRYMAYIKPSNFVSGVSSMQVVEASRGQGITLAVFDEVADGIAWLREQQERVRGALIPAFE